MFAQTLLFISLLIGPALARIDQSCRSHSSNVLSWSVMVIWQCLTRIAVRLKCWSIKICCELCVQFLGVVVGGSRCMLQSIFVQGVCSSESEASTDPHVHTGNSDLCPLCCSECTPRNLHNCRGPAGRLISSLIRSWAKLAVVLPVWLCPHYPFCCLH